MVVLNPKTHQIKSDFTALYYPPHLKCLVLATDVINMLQIEVSASTTSISATGQTLQFSHANAITACAYNHTFGQIVTADEQGIVKVWDLDTNRKTFEFAANVPVTCLRFDDSHRFIINFV